MSTYEISKSSLLSLKAEILKKQEELNKAKLENKSKVQKEVKKGPLEFKNKGVENRRANDVNSDDEDLLRKSRVALEAKSKLYEKLVKGTGDPGEHGDNRKYLVHFEKKSRQEHGKVLDFLEDEDDVDKYPENDVEESNDYSDYRAENSDDEWVEYTDCFGRTRTCLRKDLPSMKEKDENIRPNVDSKSSDRNDDDKRPDDTFSEGGEFSETSEMLSGDMRKELQRQQWEREENELRDKKNIHYQDVLFSEARTHGVGYYAFSKDDDVREKQQEALNKIRQETKEQQRMAQEIKKNREKQLKARILAANNRKRARIGLPPLELDDETEVVENVEEKPKIEVVEKEDKKAAARKKHVRPWDVGKEGVVKEHQEYSQKEWVQLQRKKRDNEFAPPRAYNSAADTLPELSTEDANKGLYFSSKKRSLPDNIDTSKPPPVIRKFVNPYKFTPTPIQDECLDDDDEDDRLLQDYKDLEDGKRGSSGGVEIAPPPTYEYYGPSASKARKNVQPKSSMEESIMEGLKFLREKIEKKKSNR